ncbi:hypothetical protein FJTKL_13650 [Diaporthe vaccinii]|uniref:Uncharacterized protein n=1 Tax=Diaporthe vaccinii TaxID=105482 RepID=A0ABR4E9I9_9PEZI
MLARLHSNSKTRLDVRHCYVSVDEGHPTQNPDAPQHDTPLLSNPEISDSSASVETGADEPGNRLQRPALDQSAEHTHPTWTDFYFRPLFLISLSVFLVLMIAALEVGHYISQHNQGLVTASEDMHYVWTYGPTLVLTIVAALWGQLELRARQIMPCLQLSLSSLATGESMIS